MILVIPCYNEASRLDTDSFARFGAQHDDIRFLFVDDGSRDATREVLTDLAGRLPGANIVSLSANGGKAEAVRVGILRALETSPDYVGFWDADLATPLPTALDFRDVLDAHPNVDMVFGARVQLLGHAIERRASRHYAGRIFATIASWMLGLPVYDTQCGAKLFRVTPSLPDIFATPFLTRWIFDVEIVARALVATRREGASKLPAIHEYPLAKWRDVGGSKLHFRDLVHVPLDLIRIYNAYLRNL